MPLLYSHSSNCKLTTTFPVNLNAEAVTTHSGHRVQTSSNRFDNFRLFLQPYLPSKSTTALTDENAQHKLLEKNTFCEKINSTSIISSWNSMIQEILG